MKLWTECMWILWFGLQLVRVGILVIFRKDVTKATATHSAAAWRIRATPASIWWAGPTDIARQTGRGHHRNCPSASVSHCSHPPTSITPFLPPSSPILARILSRYPISSISLSFGPAVIFTLIILDARNSPIEICTTRPLLPLLILRSSISVYS